MHTTATCTHMRRDTKRLPIAAAVAIVNTAATITTATPVALPTGRWVTTVATTTATTAHPNGRSKSRCRRSRSSARQFDLGDPNRGADLIGSHLRHLPDLRSRVPGLHGTAP